MMFTAQNDRPQSINIACFLTDGKASDKRALFDAANEAKKKGIPSMICKFIDQSISLPNLVDVPPTSNIVDNPVFCMIHGTTEELKPILVF